MFVAFFRALYISEAKLTKKCEENMGYEELNNNEIL